MRRGTSILQLVLVLVMLGILSGLAVPRWHAFHDRIAADAGATAVVALLSTARHAAVRRARVTAIRFDTSAGVIIVQAGADTVMSRSLRAVHGVRLAVSRDSIAYAPTGMGYGAANTRIIVSRGAAAETLTVSRLGRVQR